MTTDPHTERAAGIAKAIREDSSDPASFPLWKPWAMDMADGIDALAARLEAAERDLAEARLRYGSFLDWSIGYTDVAESVSDPWIKRLHERLREERAALAAAQQPPASYPCRCGHAHMVGDYDGGDGGCRTCGCDRWLCPCGDDDCDGRSVKGHKGHARGSGYTLDRAAQQPPAEEPDG